VLFHCYCDQEAVPRPVDVQCPTDAWFYLSLFQDPSRVIVTCSGPKATLLDYVGGLQSEMDGGLFLLSCGGSGGNGEVGDGRRMVVGLSKVSSLLADKILYGKGFAALPSLLSSLLMMATAAAKVNAYLHHCAMLLPRRRIHGVLL
jgi:hypothetical protein